jgi:hypothetical protein
MRLPSGLKLGAVSMEGAEVSRRALTGCDIHAVKVGIAARGQL